MDFNEWLNSLPGQPTASQAADAADLSRATAIRHSNKGATTSEYAVAIARAYDINEAQALIDLDMLGEDAVEELAIEVALTKATNQQLLDEINTRVDPDSREKFRGEGQDDVIDLAPDVGPVLYAAADSSPDEPEEGDDDFGGGA